MKVARSWSFSSDLTVDGVLNALKGNDPYAWSIRDSEYEGRYVLGRAPDGNRIRVLFHKEGRPSFEYYFAPDAKLDDSGRDALAGDALSLLSRVLRASDVQQEP